jgi:hypothetical protein
MTKNAQKVMALYMALPDDDRQEIHMTLHDYEKANDDRKRDMRESFARTAGVVLETVGAGSGQACGI